MAHSDYSENYVKHYLNINAVYPSVFALKMFLGRSPELNFTNIDFSKKSILDIGFGDGRDILLFHNLGFEVFGVEVDQKVVEHTKKKFTKMGIKSNLSVGYNDATGFAPNTFDFVYSSAALMYLRNKHSSIRKTLNHVFEIVKPDGYFLGTFTKNNSHITLGSIEIDQNRIICKDRFYKQRKGQLYWVHHSKEEVEFDLLNAGFKSCKVFSYDVDWFGTHETAYLFVANK